MTARLRPSYRFGIAREGIREYRRPGIQPKWKTWVPRRELTSRIRLESHCRWDARTSSRVLVQRSRLRSNTGVSPAAGHDRWQSFLCEPERLVQSVVQFVEEALQPANDGVIDGVQGTRPRSRPPWSTMSSHQMFDDKDVLVCRDRQMAVDQTKAEFCATFGFRRRTIRSLSAPASRLDLRIFHMWSGSICGQERRGESILSIKSVVSQTLPDRSRKKIGRDRQTVSIRRLRCDYPDGRCGELRRRFDQ